jgi:hypothetical protein
MSLRSTLRELSALQCEEVFYVSASLSKLANQ